MWNIISSDWSVEPVERYTLIEARSSLPEVFMVALSLSDMSHEHFIQSPIIRQGKIRGLRVEVMVQMLGHTHSFHSAEETMLCIYYTRVISVSE